MRYDVVRCNGIDEPGRGDEDTIPSGRCVTVRFEIKERRDEADGIVLTSAPHCY